MLTPPLLVLTCSARRISTIMERDRARTQMTLTASPLDGHLVLETLSNSQMALDAGIIEPLITALAAAGSNTCPCVLEEVARALSRTAIHGTRQQVKYFVDQGCVPPLCALLVSKHAQVAMLALEGLEGICKAGKADSPLCEGENETARCGPTLHAEAIYKAQGLVNLEALRDYEDDEDDEDDEIKFEMRDFAGFLIDTYFGNETAMLVGVEWAETNTDNADLLSCPPPAGISLPDAGKTDAQPSDKPEDVAGDVFDKSPEETARNVCAHCGAAGIEEAPLLRCAKCKTRLFCSKKCQRKDWVAGHRGTCTTPEQM